MFVLLFFFFSFFSFFFFSFSFSLFLCVFVSAIVIAMPLPGCRVAHGCLSVLWVSFLLRNNLTHGLYGIALPLIFNRLNSASNAFRSRRTSIRSSPLSLLNCVRRMVFASTSRRCLFNQMRWQLPETVMELLASLRRSLGFTKPRYRSSFSLISFFSLFFLRGQGGLWWFAQ